MIPKQLQKDRILFCKVMEKSKRPFEKDWVNKGYSHQEIDISTGNYGVLAGPGDLIIIDSDTQELQEAVDDKLPKTFRVRTGSGGCHDYYFCKDLKKKLVLTKDGKHYGEVQSYGTQVIGPGSIHPNGQKYEVEQDLEIQTLELSKLIEVVKPFTAEFNKKIEWESTSRNEDNESDINTIKIKDIISGNFQKQINGEYLGPNPWHGSSTGINFCVNDTKNIAHCFRCNCGVNVAQAIGLNEGIISNCDDKLSTNQFLQVLKIAQEKHGLKKFEPKPIEVGEDIVSDIYQLIALKKREDATEVIVKYILDNTYLYTTRHDERNEMWIYKNGIYVPEGKSFVNEICRQVLGKLYTSHLGNAVMIKIEADTAIDQKEFFESATKNVEEIPIENGIFNLVEKKLYPFNPEKIFFNKLPVIYDPNATCPNIEQHFRDVLKSEDDVKVMYELFGYLLWKNHFIEKAVMMVGGGRNGKGKTIDLMKRFLGIDNCASVPLYNMEADTFRIAELFGMMANLAGDLSNVAVKETGMFKQITGRDLLGAKRKFKSSINFINYSKQIFACNELPRVYDSSLGFWDRWMLFEFPYVFLNKFEYEKSNLENKKEMNPEQIEKISTQEELSGLFNKAVDSLEIIRKNGTFSYSTGTDDVKQFWIRGSDSFAAFCMDHLEEKYGSKIIKKDLRKAYHNYCKKYNLKGTSDANIKRVLEETFGASSGKDGSSFDTQEWVWEGVRFRGESKYNFQKGGLN